MLAQGFNIGDYIIPILLIGGAIVQWLSSRNKEEEGGGTDPFGGPASKRSDNFPVDTGDDGGEWEELMEALGHKEQRQQQAPPALPTREEIHRRQVGHAAPVTPRPEPVATMPEKSKRMLDAWQQRRDGNAPVHPDFQHTNIGAIGAEISEMEAVAYASPYGKAGKMATRDRRASRFKTFLADKESVRKAIVLNEILSPPVSMR